MMPDIIYKAAEPINRQIGTLANGIRVISHNTIGQAVHVGLYVQGGSSFPQVPELAGVSQIISQMFLKRSEVKSYARNVRESEQIGTTLSSQCMRESISYGADSLKQVAPYAFRILREGTLEAAYAVDEVEEAKQTCLTTLRTMQPETAIVEALHLVAYDHQGLGLPMFGTTRSIQNVTSDLLHDVHAKLFCGKNMVVAAAGLDHATAMKVADNEFGHLAAGEPVGLPYSPYVGGDFRHNNEELGSTTVAISLKGPGWKNEKDITTACALVYLLGGGASFSEGGPGKGMYSKLYQEVLSGNSDVVACNAFNHMYYESSLFGITGVVVDEYHAKELAVTIADQLRKMQQVTEEQISRAKNGLIASIYMNLESRFCLNDDVCRQHLMTGTYRDADSLAASIRKLTAADFTKVAQQMLKEQPSVAVIGSASRVPRYEKLASIISGR